MAKDATYQPGVYRSSGGDQLDISSGGYLVFQNGGTLTLAGQAITSTGAVNGNTLAVTAGLSVSSTLTGVTGSYSSNITCGKLTGLGTVEGAEVKTTVSTSLSNYGVSVLTRSSAGTITYTIAPVTGIRKQIMYMPTTSTGLATVQTTGTYDGAATNALFSTATITMQLLDIYAVSTSRWYIVSANSGITFT
jgi:hypothetical protein